MDLAKQSDFLSCKHIKQLNIDYCRYNSHLFDNNYIKCDLYNNLYNNNINYKEYLNNPEIISKKTCFDYSNIKNDYLWTNNFNSSLNTSNLSFNQNTKMKLFTNY